MRACVSLLLLTAVTALLRLHELRVSRRNLMLQRADAARRGKALRMPEKRAEFALIVLAQVLLLGLPVVECLWLGARAPTAWLALALVPWSAAQVLRFTSMRALGTLWNARGAVADGQPIVRSGPYRWLRHPNYLGVLLEGVALPLAGGAWRSLLLVNLLLIPVTVRRARAEERLLARNPDWRASVAHLRGFLPRIPA
jgi:methyltransferase